MSIDTRKVAPLPIPTQNNNTQLLYDLLGIQAPTGIVYNDESVGGLPALSAGVDKVANAVATMMTSAKCYRDIDEIDAPLIVTRPCPLYGSYEFYQMVTRSLMMRGNFIALVASVDADGNPEQVVPVPVDQVALNVNSGLPVYSIHGEDFNYEQVLHIRSHCPIGALWGVGIIERFAKALNGALYEQHYGESSYRSGGVPSAIIKVDTDSPTSEQVSQVAEGWAAGITSSGDRKPAVIGNSMTFTPIGWTPQDAEFVESTKLTVAQCALMCGLNPGDLSASLGDGKTQSYGNRTDDAIQRVTDAYSPWSNLIEQSLSDLLPYQCIVMANPDALHRMSIKERLEIQKLRQELNISTEEETRQLEQGPTQ